MFNIPKSSSIAEYLIDFYNCLLIDFINMFANASIHL